MSIPPLVCSTPPPPDQCEDDKYPEDFDIQYNLSQDEDDVNAYDYGNFSTYNHLQSSQIKPDPVITKFQVQVDLPKEHKNITENDLNKGKNDEDTNIEDLNLQDLKDQDRLERINDEESNIRVNTDISSRSDIKEIEIPGCSSNIISPIEPQTIPIHLNEFEPPSTDPLEEPPSYVDEIISAVDNILITPTEPDIPFDKLEDDELILKNSSPKQEEKKEIDVISEVTKVIDVEEVINDDGFSDFDDFQFSNPVEKPTVLDSCDNPWQNNQDITNNDFGDFKAQFDDFDNNETTFITDFERTEQVPEDKINDKINSRMVETVSDTPADDDFGDFEDFQSSTAAPQPSTSTETEELKEFQQAPVLFNKVLDLQSLEDEEIVNSVINEIYKEVDETQVSDNKGPQSMEDAESDEEAQQIDEDFYQWEPISETALDLNTMLGVTWGHLLQIDERQPYIVNWNNSSGQKTLLKALCIDSRNILFAPKWNYNMPKYAATLTAAPLQPQKPIPASVPQSEAFCPEKTAGNTGTWSDPFTSDGKESCIPDTSKENPVVETGPTDLDVFEASASSKPDKIFSSTLNLQPIRQISLPDTHIFTPTDSETPRSTTIHYDNSPTVLLPQTFIETSKSETHALPTKPSVTPTADNDEYWEFQDFKGSTQAATSIAPQNTEPVLTATQVLQPIKIEPIIPTLNWPDPGEVKETFDDFSDFVSSTSVKSPQQTPILPIQTIDIEPTMKPVVTNPSNILTPNDEITKTIGDFDDDFDTFQSAVPSTSSVDFNITSLSNNATSKPIISPQAPSQQMTDFDFAFRKAENVKPDSISSESTLKNTTPNTLPFFPNNLEVKNKPPQVSNTLNAGVLQPTPASSSTAVQNTQKSAQILQPLSLESFSQINWPNPGIDLQDLSRFNPVETLHSLKSDLSVNNQGKVASPVHSQKTQKIGGGSQCTDDDWGEFVSSKPPPQPIPKKNSMLAVDDDEWTDFVSSPSVKPQNGLNTISLNVHTNFQSKPNKFSKGSKLPLDIPTLNYITPKSSSQKTYNDKHFQNL